MRRLLATGLVALGQVLVPALAPAQTVGGRSEVFAGSELENYLRLLQDVGEVPLYPWSVRAFSPAELDRLTPRDTLHPWAQRYDFAPRASGGLSFDLVRPRLNMYFNTTFPYGSNDGPVWQGRGLTTSLQFGFAARYGPISLTIAPMVFWAENQAFPLMANGQTGRQAFADAQYPRSIDRPQRFGATPYYRLDPGQSTLRLDLGAVAAGISTANQVWGPAAEEPLILGNNAAGFPHIFLGTARPVDLWIARLHGHVVYGYEQQSAYSPDTSTTGRGRRFMTGFVVTVMPRGVPGLELGVTRFFHNEWPAGGLSWSDFEQPFQAILKASLGNFAGLQGEPNETADNQVASVFGRWVFPENHFEIYGEYGREDHNWDLRDLMLEPDHSGGFTVGFRKVWPRAPGSFIALRAELMNTQVSELVLGRGEGPFYIHSPLVQQGHTEYGQVLGAPDGNGGAASIIALDYYHQGGRWTVTWTRSLQGMTGQYLKTGVVNPHGMDVVQTLSLDGVLFRGPLDVTGGLAASYEFNRYFQSDAFNLNASLGLRADLGGSRAAPRPIEPTPASSPSETLPGLGQIQLTAEVPGTAYELAAIGSEADDRDRVAQLLGMKPTDGYLVRSASSRSGVLSGDPRTLRWAWVTPEIKTVVNSTIPFSLNDGALWAGRGTNVALSGGVHAEWGPLFVTLAPQYLYSQNRAFTALPDSQDSFKIPAGRSPWSSPFHTVPYSADLPIRFGDRALSSIDPGQSVVAVRTGILMVGVSTENEWWGPGIQNAIVLSDNAAGIPRLFVRTAQPWRTGAGSFEAVWFVGGLSQSRFFDTASTSGLRSISALAVTWRPLFEPGLTLGLSRAVYAPVARWGTIPFRLFDVFKGTGHPNNLPLNDSSQTPGPDQVASLFGRWVFPRSGFETWFEWARNDWPVSLRDLLTSPGHSQGYTLGVQWAKPVRSGEGAFRLQAELTQLERDPSLRQGPVGTWYTSRTVVQGYTQAGKVIGAAIGPGSSGEWLAADYLAGRWSIGVFAGRIRWENDALYQVRDTLILNNLWCSHDVSLFTGVRGSASGKWGQVSSTFTVGKRFDMYFENTALCGIGFDPAKTYSPTNTTLEIRFSPRLP
jgi:hypothetical protein